MNFKNIIKNIYKKIVILFFLQLYPKPKLQTKTIKKFVKIDKFSKENKIFKVIEIVDGRVYTNSVDDAAFIHNNILISMPSYQYRNSLNAPTKYNSVLKYGTPRKIKKINGNILSLLSGGAAKINYGHWIFDVLTRILIFKKKYKLKDLNYLLVPSYKNEFQVDTLKAFGINKIKVLDSELCKHIKANKIYATSHPNFHNLNNLSKWMVKDIRKIFLKKLRNKKIKCNKIFLDRDEVDYDIKNLELYKDHRILLNRKEVIYFLKKKGFNIIKPQEINFWDQVNLFNKAKVIISLSGAGLSNIIFCKPGTKIIEIKNNNRLNDFLNISRMLNLKHQQISIKPKFKTKVYQNGILNCPVSKLKKHL